MVRPGYPFRDRDPNRRDDMAGNRRDDMAGNRRDDMAGNRRDDTPSNRRDDQPGSRRDQQRPDRRPRPEAAPSSADLGSLAADIEVLLRLVSGTDVTELQIERGDLKVLIRRGAAPAHPVSTVQPLPLAGPHPAPGALVAGEVRGGTAPPAAPDRPAPSPPGAAPHPAGPILGEREHLLTAPMVGTFYSAPSPKDAPFVAEGDMVEAGQTIGIIEAMKIMNEIEAEVAGRVKRILARDGQGVEYGQPLLVIEEV
jgi:acetyl-CoA carboxylase biotin carboxyl carrier protein